MPIRTSVVILNWNTRHFLDKFLPNVIKFSEGFAEVVVVDNASSDDSVDFVKKKYPTVKIIENDSNLGYTGGYNNALTKIDSEYFVLLNSDVEVTENWLSPLIDLMDKDKSIGACQPKV